MKLKSISKILWLGSCVAVLWVYYGVWEVHDASIVFMYSILALTFPIGALIQGLFFYAGEILDLSLPNTFTTDVIIWTLFVIIGYLQWFVALPWLIKRLKLFLAMRRKPEIIS